MKQKQGRILLRSAFPLALLLALLVVLFSPVSGRDAAKKAGPDASLPALERLQQDSNGRTIVSTNSATGVASFLHLTGEDGEAALALTPGFSAAAEAQAFFANYGEIFGIQDAGAQLQFVDAQQNVAGHTRLTYAQVHEGVDVFAGVLRVQLDENNRITSVNGAFIPDIKVSTTPALSAEEAHVRAVNHVQGQLGLRNALGDLAVTRSHLFIFREGLVQRIAGPNRLVYEVEVTNSDGSVREFVYVDAHSGAIVDQITGIHSELDRTVSETNLGNVIWEDSAGDPDPIPADWEGGSAQQVTDWQNEIDGAAETYNLFSSMTSGAYVSYDGLDATMRTVNNDPGINCPNANWNGTSTNYCSGVTADDVVAHEWGHAYTEYTNGLIYQWQSGALNESYSDIWGETVDLLNGRGTDAPGGLRSTGACSVLGAGSPSTDNTYRWLMGEDATAFNGAIRDMWNPTCYGHPGKVTDEAQYVCTTFDNGGVHINSGIPNHAFALMVDGGTYNGQTVTGIGLTKAAHIHWEAQNMLTPASNFVDHADALEAACTALIGVNLPALSTSDPNPGPSGQVITPADCQEVAAAIAAVEFRTEPTFCEFEPLLEPDAPPLCEGYAAMDPIFSEDWEGGALPAGWTVGTHDVANPATFDTPNWAVVDDLPSGADGDYAAFVADLVIGNCVADDETGALYLDSPVMTLPAGAPHMAFDHWVATEAGWDGGNVKVSVNGDPWELLPASAYVFNAYNRTLNTAGQGNTNPLGGQPAFTGSDGGANSGSWGQSQVDLSGIAEAGDDVQFRFDFGVDACNGLIGWYVDQVQVYACSGELAPPSIDVQPGSLSVAVAVDNTRDVTLNIGNTGDEDLIWAIEESATVPVSVATGKLDERAAPAMLPAAEKPARDDDADAVVNVISDGSFEAGTPNPYWDEGSTNFGTPLCTNAFCGGPPPHSGSWFAWFGGINALETGYLRQDVVIREGDATLSFWLSISTAKDTGDDFLKVSIDGAEIFAVTDADAGSYAVYKQVVLDVSAYADGAAHTLSFDSTVTGGGTTNFFVDDVVLDSLTACNAPVDLPWVSVAPTSGTTSGGDSSVVQVTFDATGLSTGTYEGTLCVDSNDAVTPRVEVPLQMTVEAASYDVTLGPDQDQSGVVGETVTYTVQITNTGNAADTFGLSVTGSSWNTTLSQASVSLNAGQSASFEVYVEVPGGAAQGTVDTAVVTATSQGDAGATDATELETTAITQPSYGVVLSGDQMATAPVGQTVTYTLQITNIGNVADTFDLSVTGSSWNTTLSQASVALNAGQSASFEVYVEVPGGAADGDVDTVTVTATSQGDPSQSDSAALQTTATADDWTVYLPALFRP